MVNKGGRCLLTSAPSLTVTVLELDEEDGDEFSILEEEGTNDLMNDRVTAETRKGGEEAEDEEEL